MNSFDYIISGVGGAGLLLAEQLANSQLKDKSVLLLDPDSQTATQRTWCFWLKDTQPWKHVVSHKWHKLAVHTPQHSVVKNLGDYQYCLLKGDDFHSYAWEQIEKASNIEYMQQATRSLASESGKAVAQTDAQTFEAEWIFNSSHWAQDVRQMQREHTFLWQHFKGWWIETEQAIFDTDCITLMDFRTEQHGEIRFFYVLPVAENKALVELTAFSEELPTAPNYEDSIRQYITEQLKISDFSIYKKEKGAIPMTTAPFEAKQSERVFNIGTVGGAVKPSTGYTFMNSWVQVLAIVKNLESGLTPSLPQMSKGRFGFYDTLLLHLLKNHSSKAATIFYSLFKNNSTQKVLTFLNEETTIWDEMQLFYGLPKELFLKALWETYIFRPRTKAIHLNPVNPVA